MCPTAGRGYLHVMDRTQLIRAHPTVFHMADDSAWPSIQAHGLLSARALVDLYAPAPAVREAVLQRVRRHSIVLDHPVHGRATVRDQGPLKYLDRCLTPGTTAQQYLDALNGRVFFWLTRERLLRLLGAARYRARPQIVLHLDTAQLLHRHAERIQLAPYNTGDLHVPTLPARGSDVFVDVDAYPYTMWRAKRGMRRDAIAELTVRHSVPDVAQLTTRVERWSTGQPIEILHQS